jgi:hypothetical protein
MRNSLLLFRANPLLNDRDVFSTLTALLRWLGASWEHQSTQFSILPQNLDDYHN